jgi:histidyl-tRNA synthetase
MFRYERMKTGRYRQFWQLGAEAYGASQPAQDVELIELALRLLGDLGLPDVKLHLNSLGDDTCRPTFLARLKVYLLAHRSALCAECQGRLQRNPLRVLDCKQPDCQGVLANAPSVLDALCPECQSHLDETRRGLDLLGLAYELDPRLVRGLDYYTRTAFEFIAQHPVLGTASAVGGGGRYDKLIQALGGPALPGVGWAMGVDRLCLLMGEAARPVTSPPDLFVAWVGEGTQDFALQMVSRLRQEGVWVEFDARGGSLKSQMKRADKSGARHALVLGEAERERGSGQLKPMQGGEPREVRWDDLSRVLKTQT